MNVFVFILLTIFLSIVVPTFIIFHFITKWRQDKILSGEDERMLLDLMQAAERMDHRISTLEHILDTDQPTWRAKYQHKLYESDQDTPYRKGH